MDLLNRLSTLLPLVALSACGGAPQPLAAPPTPCDSTVLRPPGVPAEFVDTPNGWFHPSCVLELEDGDRMREDGRVERSDGRVSDVHTCAHPHYDRRGRAVLDDGTPSYNPTVTGWVEDIKGEQTVGIGSLQATWQVPAAPVTQSNQVLHYWAGLESYEATGKNAFVLQPVLSWNRFFPHQWSIASWNCCQNGVTWHSPPAPVNPGDTIFGALTGSACSHGACSSWSVAAWDFSNNQTSSLQTTAFGYVLDKPFTGVLEASDVDYCSKLPANGNVTFSNVSMYDTHGTPVAPPVWDLEYWGQYWGNNPYCNWSTTVTDNSTFTIGSSQPGGTRLDLFVTGTDNQFYRKFWDGTGAGWQPNELIGGVFTSGVAAVSWAPGRYDAFARDTNGYLAWSFWNGVQNNSGWSLWQNLGGPISGTPAVSSWGLGDLDVFVRGTDNNLYHVYWNGSGFTWQQLGHPPSATLLSGPGAVSWGPGRTDVFVAGSDYQLWHIWYNNGSWSNWEAFGDVIVDSPAVSSWGPGRLDVFMRDTYGHLLHRYYDQAHGGWHNTETISAQPLMAAPAAVSRAAGHIDVFYASQPNGRVYHQYFPTSSGTWSSWEDMYMNSYQGVAATTW
jgi:hypothetical protein